MTDVWEVSDIGYLYDEFDYVLLKNQTKPQIDLTPLHI
jgi:hypothetical protein